IRRDAATWVEEHPSGKAPELRLTFEDTHRIVLTKTDQSKELMITPPADGGLVLIRNFSEPHWRTLGQVRVEDSGSDDTPPSTRPAPSHVAADGAIPAWKALSDEGDAFS